MEAAGPVVVAPEEGVVGAVGAEGALAVSSEEA